jgi:UDP-N-acetylglucosamine kinase
MKHIERDIFDKKIWPHLTVKNPQPSNSPHLYVLGGQPGAGKSQLEKPIKKYHGADFVSINGDEFRKFHPHFDAIEKQYGIESSHHTAEFSGKMTGMALQKARDEKLHVLVEGTFRTVETPLKTLEDFQSAGYQTTVMIATCPKEVSWSSTLSRYSKMAQANVTPRFTPKDAHDVVIDKLAGNVDEVLSRGKVGQLKVFNRDGQLYDSAVDRHVKPSEVITQEIHRSLTAKEHQQVLANYAQMETAQQHLQAPAVEKQAIQSQKMAYLLRSQDKAMINQYPKLEKLQESLEQQAGLNRELLTELVEKQAQQIEKA